ncbi:MAG: adenosylcobinamide-GDP ribazoletransferase [Rhodobacteraceae bacterium]|nr:adenosylcobinamide-GDP ribazoletransferase [Paracoccaceae bacterium]
MPRDISGLWRDVSSALGLLTRLPVRVEHPRGAEAAWAWPVAGVLVGGLAALAGAALLAMGVPITVAAVGVLGVQAVVTGALHEDGLADTVDGFFGGWTRERRLEIMKDSHIGSYGVLALVLTVLARWAALCVVLPVSVWAVVGVAALSRAPMAAVMWALPNARGKGLSHGVGRPDLQAVWVAVALALIVGVLAVEMAALGVALVTALAVLGVMALARARIGGQTGDVLGATQQVSEVVGLVVLAVVL